MTTEVATSAEDAAPAEASAVPEEPFDLGPDPFDDRARDAALRQLNELQLKLAAAAGRPQLAIDPVSGTALFAEEMARLYEVRRRQAIARHRPANASEVAAALRLLQLQLDTEAGQLPDQPPTPVFLATTWRSGSTFLGHVLSAPAGVFSHYEPLSALGVHQARSEQQRRRARFTLDELLACRYSRIPDYMNATRANTEDMLSHNPRVWSACTRAPNRRACTSEAFLSAACRLLPLHVFKLVRLRLRELEPQLSAGARVLYLVRDPRATVSSRLSSVRWCRSSDECVQPAQLCADLDDDLAALRELQARYPANLRLVRYERLATEPRRQLREIFEFVGFRWTAEVERIVHESTHSSTENSAPWSVLKNSAQHVDQWKKRLSAKQINYINRACRSVIHQLGYNDQSWA